MATYNDSNPSVIEKTVRVERTDSSQTGWVVAVIVLILVIAGGAYAWSRYHRAPAQAPAQGGTNINVTLPAGNTNSGGTSNPPSGTGY